MINELFDVQGWFASTVTWGLICVKDMLGSLCLYIIGRRVLSKSFFLNYSRMLGFVT